MAKPAKPSATLPAISDANSDVMPARRGRGKIPLRTIVKRLSAFVNGDIELTARQVAVALSLLRKSLPDLRPQGGPKYRHTVKRGATDYSRDDLLAILDDAPDGRNGVAGAPQRRR